MSSFNLTTSVNRNALAQYVLECGGASLTYNSSDDTLHVATAENSPRYVCGIQHAENSVWNLRPTDGVDVTSAIITDAIARVVSEHDAVGLWVDGSTLHVDAIVFTDSRDTAIELARENAQIAAFDLETFEDIYV